MNGRSGSTGGLILGAQPRVELLPVEVLRGERAHRLRRLSVRLVIVVAILVGGGYGFALYTSMGATAQLAKAQDRTATLVGGTKQFSELTSVSNLITVGNQARTTTASSEILWTSIIGPVRAALPTGVLVDAVSMAGPAPGSGALAPAGPLRSPRQATIAIKLFSPTIFDVTAVSRKLEGVPGFADVTPDVVTATTSPNGFMADITLNLNEKAFSGRFAKGAVK